MPRCCSSATEPGARSSGGGIGMDPEHVELDGAAQGKLCCRSISCAPFVPARPVRPRVGAGVWSGTIACTGLCLPGMGQYGYLLGKATPDS